ncbi:MAG: branched-chain amino acid ABC transporter permease [Pseudomonadota bacterium]
MKRLAIGSLGLLALAAVPLWAGNSYYVDVVSQMLIWAVFAMGLNVLSGYGRLTSLGHAALFGVACYVGGLLVGQGMGHAGAAVLALLATLAVTAVVAVLALRSTGISFLMITLAAGQILWGVAYRWVSVTGGENGVSIPARPAPFGAALETPAGFFYLALAVFLAALVATALLVRSPLGAALRGTRDQPRRMSALGFNVWAIRFTAFLYSGFWAGVAGLLFLYYNKFVSPHALALATSAEALLMVIVGGAGTLLGPVAGAVIVVAIKNVASGYIERWNFLLGFIFVAIIMFMPQGLVPGIAAALRRPKKEVP